MLVAGTKLGPYDIVSPIGAGGMGEVYKAKDTRLDRSVAIKVLPEHLARDPDALARFEREAKSVAALNHPNITALFDIGKSEDIAYAVMELLEGESLRTRLAHGPISPRKATDLAIQMAQGLAAAHEKGVVHRDLKPDNLWITKEGRLKILDFGLAKQTGASGIADSRLQTVEQQTEPGTVMGTIGYMSPEQVRGQSVDHRSDIFSFGVVLFEMLTGKRAFARSSAADTMAAILKEDPPEIEDSGRPVQQGLRRILDHCLEKDPARRFHDATTWPLLWKARWAIPATRERSLASPFPARRFGSPGGRRWASVSAPASRAGGSAARPATIQLSSKSPSGGATCCERASRPTARTSFIPRPGTAVRPRFSCPGWMAPVSAPSACRAPT
jgi:serine/threonine protein kinase